MIDIENANIEFDKYASQFNANNGRIKFNDKESVDHAELSVKVLFNENLIEKFNIEDKYKKIIKMAIINHNKSKIGDNLNADEMLFSKIIRDADKLDIYYTICEYDFPSIFWYHDFNCDSMNDFINNHYVDYSYIKSNADQIPIFYAYVFNFYFNFSLQFLKEKKYLDKFTDRVYENFANDNIKQQVKQIFEISNEYLNKNSK